MSKKKKKNKNKINYLTQTKLSEHFGMSSVAMGKILVDMGLRDGETKLPTEKALIPNYAEIVKYDGRIPMAIWKSPVLDIIREYIENNADNDFVGEQNPLQKLIQKHEESAPDEYPNKEALHFLADNFYKPQVKDYFVESKKFSDVRTINQWFKLAIAEKNDCLPKTLKAAASDAEWMALDNWRNGGQYEHQQREKKVEIVKPEEPAPKGESLIAYVDGSFDGYNWSSAAVILNGRGEFVEEIMGKGYIHNESRNVTGEVYGAMSAIDCALKWDLPILIYHDYEGIAKWANDEWRANLPLTQEYKQYVKDSRKRIGIRFQHVKGHSGNKWNDRADELAKTALGISL